MTTILKPPSTRCLIYTRREGVLSAIGHDLLLEAMRFEVRWDVEAKMVDARVDTTSIEVVGALSADGALESIAARDVDEITSNLQRKVLKTSTHADVRLTAVGVDASAASFSAELTLVGVTRNVRVQLGQSGAKRAASFVVHQPDFGIEPFSAMFGTLKVAADVRVVIETP